MFLFYEPFKGVAHGLIAFVFVLAGIHFRVIGGLGAFTINVFIICFKVYNYTNVVSFLKILYDNSFNMLCEHAMEQFKMNIMNIKYHNI
jgi:hypothetical protein